MLKAPLIVATALTLPILAQTPPVEISLPEGTPWYVALMLLIVGALFRYVIQPKIDDARKKAREEAEVKVAQLREDIEHDKRQDSHVDALIDVLGDLVGQMTDDRKAAAHERAEVLGTIERNTQAVREHTHEVKALIQSLELKKSQGKGEIT